MSLFTIQRSPTPPDNTDASSISHYDDSIATTSQSEDFFTSKATAILQNQIGRRRTSIIKEGDAMQIGLKKAVSLLRKEDSLRLIVNLEKVNSKIEGSRYLCVVLTNGKQDTEESVILGIDICQNISTIGLVLPICQDMSVALDGDGGFIVKTKDGEKMFKPTSVHAFWSTVQLLNKACSTARLHNYFIGGLSHTWIGFYTSKMASNRAQIAEWHRMVDANTLTNSSMAPKSAIGEYVIGTHIDTDVQNKDEIRIHLKEIMRDEDMDNVTVTFLREQLQQKVPFNVKDYRSFIAEEILIIYGQMDGASEILPYLYLGSTYNASNLEELLKNKITHILNVTRESENFFRDKFVYRNVPVFDVDETNLLHHFNDCYQFISDAKNQNSACLVHCQRGISRSASVVIAYMMKEFNYPMDKALEVVKSKRDCVRPNDSFSSQLKIYEGILKARRNFDDLILNEPLINTPRHSQQLQGQTRNKTMCFPNELCQTHEIDVVMESPSSSCPTPNQRQSVGQSDRVPFYWTDILYTKTVTEDSSVPTDGYLVDRCDESPLLTRKIDIHEDLLIYKPSATASDFNNCLLEDYDVTSVTTSENITKHVQDTYQKDETVHSIPDTAVIIANRQNSDINANRGDHRSDATETTRRSLRLKGDASWIKPPATAGRRDTYTVDNISPEESVRKPRKCHSIEFQSNLVMTADVDQQSLRPVQELLTKYSTGDPLI